MKQKLRHHVAYVALRALFRGGGHFQLSTLQRRGAQLGELALHIAKRRKKRIQRHLEMAMPELGERERKRLTLHIARHFGTNFGEMIWLKRASPEDLGAVATISGIEHLHNAREQGNGVILVTGHCGNWEFLGTRLTVAGIPMIYAVRDLYDSRVDSIIIGIRRKFGTEVIHRGKGSTRQVFKALGQNMVNGLLIDQDIRDLRGAFVPFFGIPAWTPIGAAQLSIKFSAPMVPAFGHRREDGTHLIEVHPALSPPQTKDRQEAIIEQTAKATLAIEEHVRRHPAQWVWMHRRWRTRPEDFDEAQN